MKMDGFDFWLLVAMVAVAIALLASGVGVMLR